MRILIGVFIVFFMVMSTLPFFFADISPERASARENRMLAGIPGPADIKKGPGTFIRKFDAWFKDSSGFREQLLTLYNTMEKSRLLNDIWYVDGQFVFLVGEQGHHYFAAEGGVLIPKFQGRQFLSDAQLQNMAAKFGGVRGYLDGKGIPLVIMFTTDKESVYPEFYPKLIKRGPEPDQLDVITGYLREHAGADVFNTRRALEAEKGNYLLYPLVDNFDSAFSDFGHYNQTGAFFAYRELMRRINSYSPAMAPYELHDIDIRYDELGGNPVVSLKAEKKHKKLDMSFFDGVELDRPFTWENAAYENTEPGLPVILFFADSYYIFEFYIAEYIAQHFGRSIFIHYKNISRFEKYIARYKPDIVVIEAGERGLRKFAGFLAGIPGLSE